VSELMRSNGKLGMCIALASAALLLMCVLAMPAPHSDSSERKGRPADMAAAWLALASQHGR